MVSSFSARSSHHQQQKLLLRRHLFPIILLLLGSNFSHYKLFVTGQTPSTAPTVMASPTTPTDTDTDNNCKSWCEPSTEEWSTKCSFALNCAGCEECILPSNCEPWCASNSNDWGTKCTFTETCAGCTACQPTTSPTLTISSMPSLKPTISALPSHKPTSLPSKILTYRPTSSSPTLNPSNAPVTLNPSKVPVTNQPTSAAPVTSNPISSKPTQKLTRPPTFVPTFAPTLYPTLSPVITGIVPTTTPTDNTSPLLVPVSIPTVDNLAMIFSPMERKLTQSEVQDWQQITRDYTIEYWDNKTETDVFDVECDVVFMDQSFNNPSARRLQERRRIDDSFPQTTELKIYYRIENLKFRSYENGKTGMDIVQNPFGSINRRRRYIGKLQQSDMEAFDNINTVTDVKIIPAKDTTLFNMKQNTIYFVFGSAGFTVVILFIVGIWLCIRTRKKQRLSAYTPTSNNENNTAESSPANRNNSKNSGSYQHVNSSKMNHPRKSPDKITTLTPFSGNHNANSMDDDVGSIEAPADLMGTGEYDDNSIAGYNSISASVTMASVDYDYTQTYGRHGGDHSIVSAAEGTFGSGPRTVFTSGASAYNLSRQNSNATGTIRGLGGADDDSTLDSHNGKYLTRAQLADLRNGGGDNKALHNTSVLMLDSNHTRDENSTIFTEDNSYLPSRALHGGGSGNILNPQKQMRHQTIYVDAPPGKLGVVIDTPNTDGAPVVHAIKDSSVLANLLRVNDKLVALDDEDVTNMTAINVSKMIARKQHNDVRKLTIIRSTMEE